MRVTGRLAGLVAGSLFAMACGGGSSSPPPGGNPAGPTPPPAGASTTISIVGDRGASSFTPNPATAGQGRTVAWQNTDGVVHRIMSNDGTFDTGNIAPGATSTAVTLATDGANYHCTIHPGMIGAVNSNSGAPPPCTGIYC
jgi:plastocyanin